MIFSRTKGWIGVDIGTQMIKLAQVERRGSRVELVEALSIRRQEPWPDNDEATDVPSHFEIQAALSLGTRFRGRDAAVTLPMAVCDVRTCNVEGDTDSERRAAVLRELDSVYTNTQLTREFDHWSVALPSDNRGQADNTIAFSVPSLWASRVTQDLRESGLVGHVLDGLPLATARAVALGMPRETGIVAAVDWGQHRATLCSVKNGRPLFVRCLRGCGFRSVTEALCKSLTVSADEALKLLRDHGLPDRTRGAASDVQEVIEEVAREPLGRFVDELSRTTTYLSQQRRSFAPAKVVLLGGGGAVKNMANYLDDRLELPVQTWCLDAPASKNAASKNAASKNAASKNAASTRASDRRLPIELFGPAIALSSLAWAAR